MTTSEIDFGESFIGTLTEVQWEELLVKDRGCTDHRAHLVPGPELESWQALD